MIKKMIKNAPEVEIVRMTFNDKKEEEKFYGILDKINVEVQSFSKRLFTDNIFGSSVGHVNYHSPHLKEIYQIVKNQDFMLYAINKFNNTYDTKPMISLNINVNLPGSKYQHIHRDFGVDDDSLLINFGCENIIKNNGAINILPERVGFFSSILFQIGLLRNQPSLPKGNAIIRWGSRLHGGSPNRTNIRRVMIVIILTQAKDGLTDLIWDDSLKVGPRSNFFDATYKKRISLYFASKTPFIFNFTYQCKRLIIKLLRYIIKK